MMRFGSSLRSSCERAARIRALLTEITTRMRRAARLLMATVRMMYDFFTVACLTAASIIVLAGRPGEALPWGGTGVGLALGWAAAKLAKRGVVRLRALLREEWSGAPTEGVSSGEGPMR